jgi:predicted nucleic acid-binding protein
MVLVIRYCPCDRGRKLPSGDQSDHLRRGLGPLFTNRGSKRSTPKAMIDREPIPYEAAFLAGKAFGIYRQRADTKRSTLPDFFIGAHASIAGYRLLTRDAARYRTYFPKLPLIAPN